MKTEKHIQRLCAGARISPNEAIPSGLDAFLPSNAEMYRLANFLFVLVDQPAVTHRDLFGKKIVEGLHLRPVERIFKKSEGEYVMDSAKRYVMTLALKSEETLLRQYRELHAPGKVWPQVIKNMDTMGVLDMELYLMDHQAFLVMDTGPDFDMVADAEAWSSLPMEKEWQDYVSQYQQVDANGGSVSKWAIMNPVNQFK